MMKRTYLIPLFSIFCSIVVMGETVTDICGNKYPVVTIGEQAWMAENYRCSKYDTQSEAYNASWLTNNSISTSESAVYTPYYTDATDKSKWDSEEYSSELSEVQIDKLGYLYNWSAAVGVMDGQQQTTDFTDVRQGICPNGWHMPSKSEINGLLDYIASAENTEENNIGKYLRSTSGWSTKKTYYGDLLNETGLDLYGFNILPSGYGYGNSVSWIGVEFCLWTSTTALNVFDGKTAYDYWLSHAQYTQITQSFGDGDHFSNDTKDFAFSVRCLKNDETLKISPSSKTVDAAGGSFNEKITSNTCWTAKSDKEWATVSMTSGCGNQTIRINVSENNTTLTEKAVITITTEGSTQTKSVTITRNGKEKCKASDYEWVTIGNQVWMAENYRCSKYAEGSEAYKSGLISVGCFKGSYWDNSPYYIDAADKSRWGKDQENYFRNITEDLQSKLGYLYNWAAAVGEKDGSKSSFTGNRQGICPDGWHLPSKSEWEKLRDFIEQTDGKGAGNAGRYLKSASGWYNEESGSAEENFNALPAGINYYTSIGTDAYFWTSTSTTIANYAWNNNIQSSKNKLTSSNTYKSFAMSIRCLKNLVNSSEESEIVIGRTEVTKLLDANAIKPGSDVKIGITVTQPDKVKTIILYYKDRKSTSYKNIKLSGDTSESADEMQAYEFTIPGTEVCDNYEFINYYAEVETVNGNKVNSYDGWQFYINSKQDEITRPLISNVISGAAIPCNDIVVSADITTSSKLTGVTLYYKDAGSQSAYQSVALTTAVGKNYSGKIVASATLGSAIKYYIVATDSDGRYGYYGDSSSPMLIIVNKTATASTQGAMKIEIGGKMTMDCKAVEDGTKYRAYFKSVCNGNEFEWLAGESVWNSIHGKQILTVYGNTNGDTPLKNGFNDGEYIIIKAVDNNNTERVLYGHGLKYSATARTQFLSGGNACSGKNYLETSHNSIDFGECEESKTVILHLTEYGCDGITIKNVSLESGDKYSYFAIPELAGKKLSCGETLEIPITYNSIEDEKNTLIINYVDMETLAVVTKTISLTGRSKRKSMCSGININKGSLNTGNILSGTLLISGSTRVEMSLRKECESSARILLNGTFDNTQSFSVGKLSKGDYKITIYSNDKVCEYFFNVK